MSSVMTPLAAGAIVFGRPHVDGVELSNPQRAVVLDDDGGTTLVWFPGLGDPGIGQSVQVLLRETLDGHEWSVGTAPSTWLTTTYRAARRSKINGLIDAAWESGLGVIEREVRRRRGHEEDDSRGA